MNTFFRSSADKADKGFTLIEILVVIIIIGILSAIAIPVFMKQRQKAVEASLESDLRSVAHELTAAYADRDAYFVVTGSEGHASVGLPEPVIVRTSPGNRVDGVLVGSDGYCLTAQNDHASNDLYYSDSAGLTDVPC